MTYLYGRLLAGAAALALACTAATTASAEPRDTSFHGPKLAALLDGGNAPRGEVRANAQPLPFLSHVRGTRRRILHSTVNDVLADFTPSDGQFNSTIVDLGGGNLAAAWYDPASFDGAPSGDDHFSGYGWSSNNGLSWIDAGTLPDAPEGDGIAPSLAHDAVSGAVYLAVEDSTPAPLNIQVYKSTDLSHTFGAPVNGAPGAATFARFNPRIAVDNFPGAPQGNVYLCWTQVDTGTNDVTIRFSSSINDGASFLPADGYDLASGEVFGCSIAVGAAPAPAVNFGITAAASPAAIELGESTVVTARLTTGRGEADDVFVNVTAPLGLAIRAVNGPNGNCQIINIGIVRAGTPKFVQVIVAGIIGPGTRTLGVLATSSTDSTPGNNAAPVNIPVTGASVVTSTNLTGTISVPIPDTGEPVSLRLDLSTEGTVVQLVPRIRLDHTWDEDLDIFLVSPSGQAIELSASNGGDGDNYGSGPNSCAGTPTEFNDLASTSIIDGSPPFDGSFRPEMPIAGVLGGPSDGEWRIVITDNASPDEGTVGCVTLTMSVRS